MVVAYALAGSVHINIQKDQLELGVNGKEIFLKDLWPSTKEIESNILKSSLSSEMFISRYKEIYKGDENWASIKTISQDTYSWNDVSTYIKHPPFFSDNKVIQTD